MRSAFRSEFPQWANVMLGATALAMVRSRIRKTGKASDGGNYKPYSTKPLRLRGGMFTNEKAEEQAYKEAKWFTTQGGEKVAWLPGGYKRLRKIHNLQVNHKDFLFSNFMWPSVHVAGTEKTSYGYLTTVEANNEEADARLAANEKRENKMILMVTKEEEKKLDKMLDEYITNIIKRVANG